MHNAHYWDYAQTGIDLVIPEDRRGEYLDPHYRPCVLVVPPPPVIQVVGRKLCDIKGAGS